MFLPYDPPRAPLFDLEILRRHFTAKWLEGSIRETMALHENGGKRDFHDRVPGAEELGTDEALKRAIPHLHREGDLTAKMLAVMSELRDLGLLKKIPNGSERGVSVAVEWNAFVDRGMEGEPKYGWRSIFSAPLPSEIGQSIFSAAYELIGEVRKVKGLNSSAGNGPTERVGDKSLMPCSAELVEGVAKHAISMMESAVCGTMRLVTIGASDITCPKTDKRLDWAEDRLLDPELGTWHYPERGSKGKSRFELLQPYQAPKPIRHVEIKSPSGVIYMADWFRIPGFNEGIGKDDRSGPSINSDEGVDLRTRDHFERLGLMRVHTTNCVPAVMRDGGVIRVGRFYEDHDDLWIEDPSHPDGMIPSEVRRPEEIGRVCCDLWDVTFADREILADILMAGSAVITANGGKDRRGRPVSGIAATREEAFDLLDAYAADRTVTRIVFEPGQSLHVYLATGQEVEAFAEHFHSPDLGQKPWIEDMFILSERPLVVDPDLVDEADWSWPERYACQEPAAPTL
ncbi:hypothetical protein ACEUZ9_000771 [Paracoccus litorisediminis]|uniref:hypothetical protein n=1 Tax=Paracoccus litorisediminis TaxID=2006130 RepID=UPI0037316316